MMTPRATLPVLLTLALGSLACACGSEDSENGDSSTGGVSPGGSTGDPPGNGSGGSTVDPAYAWEGKTFILDIPPSRWTEPGGNVGTEIGDYVPPFLVSIGTCTEAECQVTIGTAVNVDPELTPQPAPTQELCNPTVTVATVSATPPTAISFGPVDVPIFIRHFEDEDLAVSAVVTNMTMTNVLPSAAGEAGVSRSGVFTGTIDIGEIYPMFTLLTNPTAQSVCDSLSDYDPEATCQPCADGEPYCLTMKAEALGAVEFTSSFQVLATPQGTDCSTTI